MLSLNQPECGLLLEALKAQIRTEPDSPEHAFRFEELVRLYIKIDDYSISAEPKP